MQYTVIIRKEHCENTTYQNCNDCALARAIREQLPDLCFRSVGGTHVTMGNLQNWFFEDRIDKRGWHLYSFNDLLSGKIDEVEVTFSSPDHIVQKQDSAVKEVQEIINKPIEVEV